MELLDRSSIMDEWYDRAAETMRTANDAVGIPVEIIWERTQGTRELMLMQLLRVFKIGSGGRNRFRK